MVFFAAKTRSVFPWTPALTRSSRFVAGVAAVARHRPHRRAEGRPALRSSRPIIPLPVIVVVSDGGENASGTSLARLVATRRQSETLIYGMQTDLPPSRYAPPVNRAFSNFLPQLVGDSGGTVLHMRTPDEARDRGAWRCSKSCGRNTRSASLSKWAARREVSDQSRWKPRIAISTVRHRAGYLAAVTRRCGPRPDGN